MQIPLKISQLTTLKMRYRMFSKKVGIWDLIKEAANSFREKKSGYGKSLKEIGTQLDQIKTYWNMGYSKENIVDIQYFLKLWYDGYPKKNKLGYL